MVKGLGILFKVILSFLVSIVLTILVSYIMFFADSIPPNYVYVLIFLVIWFSAFRSPLALVGLSLLWGLDRQDGRRNQLLQQRLAA